MGNVLYSLIWLVILLSVGFLVGGFGAGLYVPISPFSVCIPALEGLTDCLMKMVQFPRTCAQNMVDGRGFN